jgi:hypothetical protein
MTVITSVRGSLWGNMTVITMREETFQQHAASFESTANA